MEIFETDLPGVYIIEPRVFRDHRGWFCETWSVGNLEGLGIYCTFVQDNQSYTAKKGTLRGIHYQRNPMAQACLLYTSCDAVYEASKMRCNRFLFTTSFSEYMIHENEKLSHDQGAPCNVYGSAKSAARIMAHATAYQKGVPFVSVAFANTFGPGDYSMRSTNLFIHRLLNGQAIDLTEGTHLYDWNYIKDTLAGLVLAGERGKDDAVYYVGNNLRRPLKDIVSDVRDYLAPEIEIRLGKYKEDFHVDYSCVDVHRLYRDTGYLAKWNFKDAVLATAEWVKTMAWD